MFAIEEDSRFHINCDCDSEEICKLFWNLDNFNDYEPEDEPDPYERYEQEYDLKGEERGVKR